MIQLPEAKAKKTIQTLAFQTPDPGFDVTISDGGLVGSQNDTAIVAIKILVECIRELRISIVNQEPYVNPFILSSHTQVLGLLLHPFPSGVVGTWREKHLSAAEVNKS